MERPRGIIGEGSKTSKEAYVNELRSGLIRACWNGVVSAAALRQLCAPSHSYGAFVASASKPCLSDYA